MQDVSERKPEKRIVEIHIKGSSMLPMLRSEEDSVFIELFADKKSYDIGDVVLYKRENGLVMHRITDAMVVAGEVVYVVCGDNQYMEEEIRQYQLAGRMVAFHHKGRRVYLNNAKYERYTNRILNRSRFMRYVLFQIRRFFIAIKKKLGN